jgi:acylphosphatase
MPQAAFHAVVSGRVQGVYFRSFTERTARQLGVRGTVRNLADGSVEVVAEGEQSDLEILIADLHRGPRGAHVEHVQVTWHAATGRYVEFKIVG